jgi:hypothetical protein
MRAHTFQEVVGVEPNYLPYQNSLLPLLYTFSILFPVTCFLLIDRIFQYVARHAESKLMLAYEHRSPALFP